MGGYTIQKAVWLYFIISSGALLLNAAKDIEMLECPPESKKLMVGEKLELQWKYNVKVSERNQWRISLYVFNNTDNAKNTLLALDQFGKIKVRQSLPLVYQRIDLKLSHNIARISIPTTTFDDTAGYGINFDKPSTGKNSLQKVTDVIIVDMFLDEADSSTVLRSWIGQSVDFVCTIILKVGADSPSFKWKNVDKNITFSNDKTSGTRTKSVLTIIPKSESDFGTYKCYARTSHAKIKHNMTLIKVDYPGYPILVNFSPRKRSLTWMAPTQEHGQRSFFTVQYLQDREKCTWIDVNKTSGLSIYLPSLSEYFPNNTVRTCSVRVCFDGKKESKNTSCSREYKVYSKMSPPPTIQLVNDSSKKATLSWQQQNGDRAEILEYVIQIFHTSTYGKSKLESIHLDIKRQRRMYTFNLDTIKDAVLRVCIRNTLCIYEKSCSKKVGLHPVFPSEPRIIEDFKFFDNSSDVKISWLEPVVRGKGKLSYIVEILKGGKWKQEIFTSDLHTTLTSPSLSDHIRVCARNDVEPKKVSCSKRYDLGKAKLGIFELGLNGSSSNNANFFIIFILMKVLDAIVHFHW